MEWARGTGRARRGDALPDCSCIQQQTDCLTATLQARVPPSHNLSSAPRYSVVKRLFGIYEYGRDLAKLRHKTPLSWSPGLHCELFCSLQFDSMNEMPPLFIEPNCKFSQCRGAKPKKERIGETTRVICIEMMQTGRS